MKIANSFWATPLFFTTSLNLVSSTQNFKNYKSFLICVCCPPQDSDKGEWSDPALVRCSIFTCPVLPINTWFIIILPSLWKMHSLSTLPFHQVNGLYLKLMSIKSQELTQNAKSSTSLGVTRSTPIFSSSETITLKSPLIIQGRLMLWEIE